MAIVAGINVVHSCWYSDELVTGRVGEFRIGRLVAESRTVRIVLVVGDTKQKNPRLACRHLLVRYPT